MSGKLDSRRFVYIFLCLATRTIWECHENDYSVYIKNHITSSTLCRLENFLLEWHYDFGEDQNYQKISKIGEKSLFRTFSGMSLYQYCMSSSNKKQERRLVIASWWRHIGYPAKPRVAGVTSRVLYVRIVCNCSTLGCWHLSLLQYKLRRAVW